jgi:hypothetical protein
VSGAIRRQPQLTSVLNESEINQKIPLKYLIPDSGVIKISNSTFLELLVRYASYFIITFHLKSITKEKIKRKWFRVARSGTAMRTLRYCTVLTSSEKISCHLSPVESVSVRTLDLGIPGKECVCVELTRTVRVTGCLVLPCIVLVGGMVVLLPLS